MRVLRTSSVRCARRSTIRSWKYAASDMPAAAACCTTSGGMRGAARPKVACAVDRKSTRLNSSHSQISYAVFCLKKKKKKHTYTSHDRNLAREDNTRFVEIASITPHAVRADIYHVMSHALRLRRSGEIDC